MAGPLERDPHRRDRGHRPGAVLRDDARRHGRRGAARRPRRARAAATPGARRSICCARGRRCVARRPEAARRRRGRAAPGRAGRRADRGLPPRRDGAPRPRARRLPRAQSAARLRPHDRLGPGRPARAGRRPRHQLHRARRRAARRSAARASRRCRRSTWSATSAAAACCSRSAWSRALLERARSGKGQVVDAAMVDGAASLMAIFYGMRTRSGWWSDERGTNMLDTRRALLRRLRDARTASTSRSARSSRSSTRELLELTGLDGRGAAARRWIAARWPALKERLAAIFKTKTRDEWCAIMEGTDVCFAPVLSHERRRPSTRTTWRAAPSSRSRASRSRRPRRASAARPARSQRPPAHAGEHTDEALADWGFPSGDVAQLRESGAIA